MPKNLGDLGNKGVRNETFKGKGWKTFQTAQEICSFLLRTSFSSRFQERVGFSLWKQGWERDNPKIIGNTGLKV